MDSINNVLSWLDQFGIFCFVGGLGSGKTLCLTWLALKFYIMRYPIYSNYHLRRIDYQYITPELEEGETKKHSAEELIAIIDNVRRGFLAFDELWYMLDSRSSFTKQNRIVSKMLLKSRKREIKLGYTSQDFIQTEKRLRRVTDVIGFPTYDKYKHLCILEFRNPKNPAELYKTFKINARAVYPFFFTREEVKEYGNY